MVSLTKSAVTGHLLKNSAGHLVRGCGEDYYLLTHCSGGDNIVTDTDLSLYVGKVVLLYYPAITCYTVSETSSGSPSSVSVMCSWDNCTDCENYASGDNIDSTKWYCIETWLYEDDDCSTFDRIYSRECMIGSQILSDGGWGACVDVLGGVPAKRFFISGPYDSYGMCTATGCPGFPPFPP